VNEIKNVLERVALVALVIVGCGVTFASAQTGTSAPPSSSNRSGENGSGSRFDLSVHLAEAYDDNLQAEAGQVTPSAYQTGGYYTNLAPTATFEARGKRVQFAGMGGTNARYYSDFGEWLGTTTFGGVALAAELAERTTMSVSQNVTHAPVSFNLFTALPSSSLINPVPPTADYATTDEKSYTYTSAVALTQGLSSRTAVSFKSDFRYADYRGSQLGLAELRSYDVGATLLHKVDKNVTFRLGYTFRNSQYLAGRESLENTVDIGVDYVRPLSASRKILLTFGVGPTAYDGPFALGLDGATQLYRLTAAASLTYPITRTWNAQAAYRRGTEYLESFARPVFTNAVTLATSGSVSRRSDLSISGAYSEGDPGLTGAEAPFTTSTASARYRVTLNRTWATYAEYLYYYYDFQSSLLLPQGVRPQLTRNSVRVGLMLLIGTRGK
jgi:hypothetical protein